MNYLRPAPLVIVLALALLPTSASTDLTRFDLNGDGRIDEEERQAIHSLETKSAPSHDPQRKKTYALITREALRKEVDLRRTERFLEADSDGDRALSEEEFSAIPAVARLGDREANKVFLSLDRDGNRLISLREFTQRLKQVKSRTGVSEPTRPAKVQAQGSRTSR